MRTSFAPLTLDAVEFLSGETDIEFGFVDFTQPHWFCVTARHDDGSIAGVCACEFKTWFDVYFTCAVVDAHCLSRRLLATIFGTLFSTAIRITAEIDADNEVALAQVRRFGFVYEGFKRMGIEGRRDALLFGMLREDCRFLPGYDPAHASIKPLNLGGQHGLQS